MATKIDDDSLLDDFKSEAEAHIEKIESAFLDTKALADDPALMDGVFRAAHSLKGTAGFFSLDKIVAVAHALESVFSRIKNGDMAPDDEIADAALQSVDCLKGLLDNLHSPDAVDTDGVLELLKSYYAPPKTPKPEASWDTRMPFDLKKNGTEDILRGAAKRGHKAYYLSIIFDKRLGRYHSNPKGLIDDIASIGGIVEAAVNGAAIEATNSDLAAIINKELAGHEVYTLELLVSSVLEPDLFLIAVELDSRSVHPIPKEVIFGKESDESTVLRAEKTTAEAGAALAPPPAQKTDLSIRLDVSVVNGLMDLANEMILTRNQLLASVPVHREPFAGAVQVLNDMSRLTSEIQERIMRTRMQPISVVFGKFPRMIRDTAKSLHKDIQIEIFGGDVAFDKYLLDALSDPITQIVKNSADHGVESASRRAALGKPQKGTITLNAYTRDGSAIIEVSDDGAGIDTETLKRKALERGTASEGQLAAMTKNALFGLIFEPGLSTAKQVTNVSGRGVGMDIVKTNIEKLGGSIEIDSEPDKGTTMRLKTPLTLSVVRALIVTINSVLYAVPELNVERVVRISAAAPSKRLDWVDDEPMLNLDGWLLPVVTLEGVEARANGLEPPSAEETLERFLRRDTGSIKFLVLKAGSKNFALLIDNAIETEETLVNPLPIYLRNCRCYSSTTVLGSGNAAMVLDAEGIMRFMGVEGAEKIDQNAFAAEDTRAGKADEDLRQVIVFKCAGAEYFALDSDKVSRIERVDPGNIREAGGGQFINVAEKTVQVIRPEDYVPVQKLGYDKNKLCLLKLNAEAPGTTAPATGLLAGMVLDKTESAFNFESALSGSGYVYGTGMYNDKALILLNSDEIVRSASKERL